MGGLWEEDEMLCRAPNLLLSSTFCYLWLMGGYTGMVFAGNVYWMCLSIMVKSFGSAVMWVYSTLLLQLRVPDAMLGRMMALEMAFFTVHYAVRPPSCWALKLSSSARISFPPSQFGSMPRWVSQ